jgi:glutathione synthase/RimK-type ligase-like ATP-grasp enzyme
MKCCSTPGLTARPQCVELGTQYSAEPPNILLVISRLAWVTTKAARGRDDDEPLGLAALKRIGVQVDVVDWTDPAVAWSDYDRAILRSAWDYPDRLPEFRRWLRSVAEATDLQNPIDVVEWSMDKHYLAELDRAGVPITPTTFLAPGKTFERPHGAFVIKPAVGAGSRDAAAYGSEQAHLAEAHIHRLHERGTTVLVQPLLASVASEGEWPLVYLGGDYSHAASKRVMLPQAGVVDDLFAAEVNVAHSASDEQRAVADAAIAEVVRQFGPQLYARVDLVKDDAGRSCVLELEMVEPSLFLQQGGPEAIERTATVFSA